MADGEIICDLLPDVMAGTAYAFPEGIVRDKMLLLDTVVKIPLGDRFALAGDSWRMTGRSETDLKAATQGRRAE